MSSEFTTAENYALKTGYGKIIDSTNSSARLVKSMGTQFNRYKLPIQDLAIGKSFSYVFFTRPDLNILDSDSGNILSQASYDPLYRHAYQSSPIVLQSLVGSKIMSNTDFLPLLSNSIKSFGIDDDYIDSSEFAGTRTGFKIPYGKNDIASRSGGQFSISYDDNRHLSVYNLHKIWIDYISKVYRGEFIPRKEYILEKRLDYAVSCYYFLTSEDGSTLIYWAKYTGVFPLNTGGNMASWVANNASQSVDLSINYKYAFRQSYDPYSLIEFNINAGLPNGSTTYYKNFIKEDRTYGPLLTNTAFIHPEMNKDGILTHKLRFT